MDCEVRDIRIAYDTSESGVVGLWVNHETRLTDKMTLKSEVGMELPGFSRDFFYDTYFEDKINEATCSPTIALEPRYYYSFRDRELKGKSTKGNKANFLALELKYFPNWFLLTGDRDIKLMEQIAITPKWGIRRTLGDHFNYEAGAGFRWYANLNKEKYSHILDNEIYLHLHLRIGYTF
ncbi:hypothetical protein [Sinomicrobium sp. M5D2P9]